VGDLDALKVLIESFGLSATVLPDLADSLDGHMPEQWSPVSMGGTPRAALDRLGEAEATLAVGAQMRAPAELLEARTGVPATVFDTVTGLDGADGLIAWLAERAGGTVPEAVKRARARLLDALADSHLEAAGARVAIAGEPDMVRAAATLCRDLGCRIPVAVMTTRAPAKRNGSGNGRARSAARAAVSAERVVAGDLDDLTREADAAGGVDLVIGPSPAWRAAASLNAPLLRLGFPQTDRAGSQYRTLAGYTGTRELAFRIANALHDHLAHDLLGAPDGPARPDPEGAPVDLGTHGVTWRDG
jgi:nitrogenase molybdenum-iron protein NifN